MHIWVFLMRKNISIIGFMGCGKTTLGKQLAKTLGLNFLDTDQWIEQTTGRCISQIFETQGEAQFRILERNAVAHAVAMHNCVIATGGGVVLNTQNVRNLKIKTNVIYLQSNVHTLFARVKTDNSRPLVSNFAVFATLLKRRTRQYNTLADIILHPRPGETPEQTCTQAIAKLRSIRHPCISTL
jgi:shikimate kinase